MSVDKKYPKTYEALMSAFAGESQARNKYDFFAKVARKEGHQKLAEFFEETSRNEHEHAKLLFELAQGISNSSNNLKAAAAGEHYETESMYPDFKNIAKEESFSEAEDLFERLAKVEKHHEERFLRLLKELDGDTLYSTNTGKKIAWVCRKCGNVEFAEKAPEKCPVCKHPKAYFEREQQEY